MAGIDKQITGNVGMYYAAYRLSLAGLNVMPTARNARGIDLLVYNADGTKFIGVQVKGFRKREAVELGKSIDHVMGDYWVIVSETETKPKTFILTSNEVRERAHRNGPEGNYRYWLETKSYARREFFDAWDRICFGEPPAPHAEPLDLSNLKVGYYARSWKPGGKRHAVYADTELPIHNQAGILKDAAFHEVSSTLDEDLVDCEVCKRTLAKWRRGEL